VVANLELQQYGTETENPTAACIVVGGLGFGFKINYAKLYNINVS